MNGDMLRDALTVARKELSEAGGRGGSLAILLGMIALGVANFAAIGGALARVPRLVPIVADMLVTHYSLSMSLFVCCMFTNAVFTKEMQTKTMESLLTTPITARSIWLGKTCFVFFAGLATALVAAAAGIAALNAMAHPAAAPVWPGAAAIVCAVTAMPLIAFGLTGALGIVNLLCRNGAVANGVLMLAVMGYLWASSTRAGALRATWTADAVLFVSGVALVSAVAAASRLLTSERIVLRLS